ncbi:MAG TPA: hypothetical protein VEM36_11905, partial [Xanthobacteraceae bacterium]|nr:hypothetical protein [Xanthobacteraceae bacterium]
AMATGASAPSNTMARVEVVPWSIATRWLTSIPPLSVVCFHHRGLCQRHEAMTCRPSSSAQAHIQ